MALPKEPRQKMINMMYLVLTALLALNVSSEILNAFVTVNTSISKSNDVITDKNDLTYKSFAAKLSDEQTKAKAALWAPKANAVKKLSSDMFNYIETLKKELVGEAGTFEKDGVQEMNADNLDAATRLMDTKGRGKELYQKLSDYRKQVIAVLNPNDPAFANNPKEQADLKAAAAAFDKSIPIDMTVPKSKTGQSISNDAAGWTQSYFHMTPAIAAMTIFSKFQNDVKNTEAQLIDYCHNQIGSVKIVYDEFKAIAAANTTYAMQGDEIEITAGIGSFSKAAQPKIYVDGQLQPLNEDGVAVYKTKASGTGEKVVNVKIDYVKPDGSVVSVPKVVKYSVGISSGASVFLEKMNVLYIGVDNPMTISGGSTGSEKVRVSFPDGSITKVGAERYVAKPNRPGMSKIIVNAEGKNFEFPMRLKSLPNPTAFVGTKKSGTISSAEFKAIGAVIAKYEDVDFEAPFRVVSYTLAAVGGPIPQYAEAMNEGNRWTGGAATLVSRTGPGTRVFIDRIQVVGPDGKQREIPPMQFNLK
jgi:gliding motility-associated protein GldM